MEGYPRIDLLSDMSESEEQSSLGPIPFSSCLIYPFLLRLVHENSFLGTSHEKPYDHMRNLEQLCSTQSRTQVIQDVLKGNLFPFSLSGKRRIWYRYFGYDHSSWENLRAAFCIRFFPLWRIITLIMVLSFKQGEDESLKMAWHLSPLWSTQSGAFATFLGWSTRRQCHET
jgi:hypothetical protein